MVRCNSSTCFDEYCAPPYPGQKGYEEARKARERAMESAGQKHDRMFKELQEKQDSQEWWRKRMEKDDNYMRENSISNWWQERMARDK